MRIVLKEFPVRVVKEEMTNQTPQKKLIQVNLESDLGLVAIKRW